MMKKIIVLFGMVMALGIFGACRDSDAVEKEAGVSKVTEKETEEASKEENTEESVEECESEKEEKEGIWVVKNRKDSWSDGSYRNYIYVYDEKGQKISEVCQFSDGDYEEYTYEYNDAGECIKIIENWGEYITETTRKYVGGLCVHEVEYEGNQVVDQTFYEYDLEGKLICETDEYGKKKKTSYDDHGEKACIEYYRADGEKYRVVNRIREYDEMGRQTTQTYTNTEYEDNYYFEVRYVYEYNEQGLLVKNTHYDTNNAVVGIDEYEYDEYGNRVLELTNYDDQSWERNEYTYEYMVVE